MKWLAISTLLFLTACGDSWMTHNQRQSFRATQSLVDERVAAGQMTPAEGKFIMAKTRADMEAQYRGMVASGWAGMAIVNYGAPVR